MKLAKYFFLLGISFVAFGCGGSDDSPVAPPVEPETPDKPGATKTITFTTDVFTRSVVTELGKTAEMNVYAKDLKSLDAEDFIDGQLKSVNKNGVWQIAPEIKLKSDQKVFLYAVYPYDEANTNPISVPIDANKQVDYLFSGDGVMASYKSPSAKLTMSHALSVLAFNVCKSSYKGTGTLQEIKIMGAKFNTIGFLDVSRGTINGQQEGVLQVKCEKQINEDGWTKDLPQTFTLPADSDGKNISLAMVIDGREYVVALPVIKIQQGNKYIFRLGLTDSGLTIFSDATETISLKEESDKMPVQGGVSILRLDYSGKSLSLPNISGKSLAPGIVNWGDKSSSEIYREGLSHDYKDGKAHAITVENWNVEEVTFSNIKGIDAVDLSRF